MHTALRRVRWVVLLIGLLAMVVGVMPSIAQQSPTTPNPNANVSFPPPVYVLRGEFPIFGTANVPGMTNYFIEFRPLPAIPVLDSTSPTAVPSPTPNGATPAPVTFFPAVLPSNVPVENGLLGAWDTSLVPDGLYEIRLTINAGGATTQILVSPLRVENNPPPEAGDVTGPVATEEAIAPTQPPPPTVPPTEDPTPRGTVSTATANVRTGDSTVYPVIASLPQGTVVNLVGISANNTGWYQVQLPSGQLGWMSPSVLTVSGNTSLLPRVQPPPPPFTATFTAIPATPTPITSTNLVAGNIFLNPNPPVCNQTFQVGVDIANLGSQANSVTGTFSVVDTHVASGTVTAQTTGPIPIIQPGVTINVPVPLTVSTFFNEEHRITVTLDPANQIPETTKADNVSSTTYVLQQGSC